LENAFGIISLLESNGVTNRDEDAEIISSLSDREISARQISEYEIWNLIVQIKTRNFLQEKLPYQPTNTGTYFCYSPLFRGALLLLPRLSFMGIMEKIN
jgi:hypothetical protein